MRVVLHWFRSTVIVGALCALPCGQAVTSPVLDKGSANRPTLTLAAVAVPLPATRSVNFVEASTPITLSSLRYGVREATPAPVPATHPESGTVGFDHGGLQPGQPAVDGSTTLDGNSMLALMLAALGMAALAAARAPVDRRSGTEAMPNEPARS